MSTFKEVLQNLMKRNRLKQTDLARELNISRQAVNKWFTKGYKPDIEHIHKLAQLFKISADELLKMLDDGNVNQTGTDELEHKSFISMEEVLRMQQKIADLQEQVIKYQAKEIEEKNRQIENKNSLRPDTDTTTTTPTPELKN